MIGCLLVSFFSLLCDFESPTFGQLKIKSLLSWRKQTASSLRALLFEVHLSRSSPVDPFPTLHLSAARRSASASVSASVSASASASASTLSAEATSGSRARKPALSLKPRDVVMSPSHHITSQSQSKSRSPARARAQSQTQSQSTAAFDQPRRE